jgi:hypothetical protein
VQQGQHAAQMQQAAAQASQQAQMAAQRLAAIPQGAGAAGFPAAGATGHGAPLAGAPGQVVHDVAGDDEDVPLPVQRPGMTQAESEAVARAQQAITRSKGKSGAAIAEVGSAVFRVEARLDELAKLVKEIGARAQGGGATGVGGGAGAGAGGVGPGGHLPRFDAVIDHASASNFYAWKKGGDVVREGGVFVASYRRSPDLGSRVAIRVTLPGGVDFEAVGIVEWTRPQGEQGPPWVQPGFGARLEGLPAQAQGLVAQFVKAREPMTFSPKGGG